MQNLHEIQCAFAEDLLQEGLVQSQELFAEDPLSAAKRFNVYRNNFRNSLADVLAAIYPVVDRLIGPDFFSQMAGHFIQRFPSKSGNIIDYGEALAAFLARYAPVSNLPYLTDVARLEWSYHSVFHAAAAHRFSADALRNISSDHYPDLHFCIGPASRLVSSRHPIFKIWETNQDGYDGNEQIQLTDVPETVLVVRPMLDVELWRLEPAEAAFLLAVESGVGLGEATDKSLRLSPCFDLQKTLAKYLSVGAILLAENSVAR